MVDVRVSDWKPYQECPICGQLPGKPCWDTRYKDRGILALKPHRGRRTASKRTHPTTTGVQCEKWDELYDIMYDLDVPQRIARLKEYFLKAQCCSYRTRYRQVLDYLIYLTHIGAIDALTVAQRDDLKTTLNEVRIRIKK